MKHSLSNSNIIDDILNIKRFRYVSTSVLINISMSTLTMLLVAVIILDFHTGREDIDIQCFEMSVLIL